MDAHLRFPRRELFQCAASHVAHPLLPLLLLILYALVFLHPLADTSLHLFFFAFGCADRDVFEWNARGEPGTEPGCTVDPTW